MFFISTVLVFATTFPCNGAPAMAEDAESVAELKKQVEALQKRVDQFDKEGDTLVNILPNKNTQQESKK